VRSMQWGSLSSPSIIVDVGTPRSSGAPDDWDDCSDESEVHDDEPEERTFGSFFGWFAEGTNVPKKRGLVLPVHVGPRVTVVGPGGGVGMNGSVYKALRKEGAMNIDVVGRSGMPYDRYPAGWPNGGAPPDLETFAKDMISQGSLSNTDCLVVGSRGGQVVLPVLWRELGSTVPPAVVINGGIAMDLPFPIVWPSTAMTFLLLGGQDYFKGSLGAQAYLQQAMSKKPSVNATTAVLYVEEMSHMPAGKLLKVFLEEAVTGLLKWQNNRSPPTDTFESIVSTLSREGWKGQLVWTKDSSSWDRLSFPRSAIQRPPAEPGAVAMPCQHGSVAIPVAPAPNALAPRRRAESEAPPLWAPVVANPRRRASTALPAPKAAAGNQPNVLVAPSGGPGLQRLQIPVATPGPTTGTRIVYPPSPIASPVIRHVTPAPSCLAPPPAVVAHACLTPVSPARFV